jgi:hypothetical protein
MFQKNMFQKIFRLHKYINHNYKNIVNFCLLLVSVFSFAFLPSIEVQAQASCQIYNPRIANFGPNCIPLIRDIQGSRSGISGIILQVADIAIFLLSAVAVLMIVYAGFLFVTDGGNGDRSARGKKILINSIVGIIIAIASYTIVSLVSGTITTLDLSNIGGNNNLQ